SVLRSMFSFQGAIAWLLSLALLSSLSAPFPAQELHHIAFSFLLQPSIFTIFEFFRFYSISFEYDFQESYSPSGY
ncbi:hypothetical protein ACFPVX_14090, partial [Cohnella faecalis]|uniref:hypothetical protein n=1 Tax=Cohnella faecalis TaxID=2315694 RepID=UPI00360CA834